MAYCDESLSYIWKASSLLRGRVMSLSLTYGRPRLSYEAVYVCVCVCVRACVRACGPVWNYILFWRTFVDVTFREILLPSSGKVSVCVWYLCVCRGSKYFKVVSDWSTLVAELYGTIYLLLDLCGFCLMMLHIRHFLNSSTNTESNFKAA